MMAWRANEVETKRKQKKAKAELEAAGGQPAYVHQLRKANEFGLSGLRQ